jgi:hypothetical protein
MRENEQLLIAKLNLIASEIKHEDDLIGQRTTWLVISQSFLFGTFVAILALKREPGMAAAFAKLLLVVIPPLSSGRTPGQPDDNEFIVIRLERPLPRGAGGETAEIGSE